MVGWRRCHAARRAFALLAEELAVAQAQDVLVDADRVRTRAEARGLAGRGPFCHGRLAGGDQSQPPARIRPHVCGGRQFAQVRQALGPEVSLILLSAPGAMGYYPKVGFTAANNAFIIQRER